MSKLVDKLNVYLLHLMVVFGVFILTIIISVLSYNLIEVKVLNYGRKKLILVNSNLYE
tara:strand:- start:213 stop:386 length:174 start_codon:yes stop_codon:yes gene_type:complete